MNEHLIIQNGAKLEELKTREITEHQTNDCNRQIKIIAMDVDVKENDTCKGRQSSYNIVIPDKTNNVVYDADKENDPASFNLFFQKGSTTKHGINGLTFEVLCAIMLDRMRYFQSTELKNDCNEECIKHLEKVIELQKKRADDRVARGVYDTYNK